MTIFKILLVLGFIIEAVGVGSYLDYRGKGLDITFPLTVSMLGFLAFAAAIIVYVRLRSYVRPRRVLGCYPS